MEVIVIIAIIIVLVVCIYYYIDSSTAKYINELVENEKEMSIEEFLSLDKNDVYPGVYIILNETNKKYYVGQGKKVIERSQMHFKGKGNGDIYADYRHGDIFKIKIINMYNTKYDDLDKLERVSIKVFDSYYSGYNKTRGNGGLFLFNDVVYHQQKKKITKSAEAEIRRKVKLILDGEKPILYEQFENIRQLLFGTDIKFQGIYILFNETKDIYLIGSSTDLFSRISRQFNGDGNGDFYSDYKSGDTIKIIMKYLTDSKYNNVKSEINKEKERLNIKNTY